MVVPYGGSVYDRGDREVREITLHPPAGLFAAVQIETADSDPDDPVIVGAALAHTDVQVQVSTRQEESVDEGSGMIVYTTVPVYETRKEPMTSISTFVLTDEKNLRLRWVYEDSSQGFTFTTYKQGAGRRW